MYYLIEIAHKRARTTITILIALILSGAWAYKTISKESFPDVTIPVLYVSLSHDGISPKDSERLIIRPIEQELRSLEGVKEMRSTAYEGGGSIQLEYDIGFNSEQALIDVRDKLDRVQNDLPKDTKTPRVVEVNLSQFPVVSIPIYGDAPQKVLQDIAKRSRDLLETIPNVLEVNIKGVREDVIEIVIDRIKLENYGLVPQQLLTSINRANSVITGGNIDSGSANFGVKLEGLIETSEEILDFVVAGSGQDLIRVRDVAEVRKRFKDREDYARFNGEPAVILNVSKRTGTNMIETIAAVRHVMKEFSEQWPQTVQYTVTRDQSIDVKSDLNDLQNNVISSVLLVFITLLLTLGLRAGLLVGIAIPGAFLSAILFLYIFGFTVNMVVLFALILSVGMLVDGAIVVNEYAERQLSAGVPSSVAFRTAAKRMSWPIIASTATTLAAFFPLLFWPGVVGEFMLFIPITLIATLTAALAMALVFIPVLGVHLGRLTHVCFILASAGIGGGVTTLIYNIIGHSIPIPKAAIISISVIICAVASYIIGDRLLRKQYATISEQHHLDTNLVNDIDHIIPTKGLSYYYICFLRFLLKFPSLIIFIAIISLFGSWAAYIKLGHGVEFFPNSEPSQFNVNIKNRDNLSLDGKEDIVKQLESIILEYQQDKGYFKNIELSVGKIKNNGQTVPNMIGQFSIEFIDWYKRPPANDIMDALREKFSSIHGVIVEIVLEKKGPKGDAKPINIEISAYDNDQLKPTLQRILNYMNSQTGYVDIEDSRSAPAIDWSLEYNQDDAAEFSVDSFLIRDIVQLVTSGRELTSYRPDESDNEIDIIARFPEDQRSISTLNDINIKVNDQQVPVRNFITFEPVQRVGELHRADGKRIVFIRADVKSGVLVNDKLLELQEYFDSEEWANGVTLAIKGENEDQAESQEFLSRAFTVAIVTIAMILLTQFNSFFCMVLILSAVIMSTVSVLLGLLITKEPFGIVMSGLGVIALAGIVVNNNIVLIDTYNIMRQHTKDGLQAILITCAQRFRPVLLTTITTILGLMPMVLQLNLDFINNEISLGAPSTQFWVQLAKAITFGLIFSTILTLCVTPSALLLMDKYVTRRKNILAKTIQRTISKTENHDNTTDNITDNSKLLAK